MCFTFRELCSNTLSFCFDQKESMGLKEGRFSRFVFDQCYQQGQYARLLRFGEEFGEEVSAYLEQHPLLLWLHELFLCRFTRASGTLHTLAFSQKSAPLNISHRRRLLQLAKLSALAGHDLIFLLSDYLWCS